MTQAPLSQNILDAEKRIRPLVRETPLDYSWILSSPHQNVYLKLENLQHTGSFKLRGASNKLLSLTKDELAKGVVTASTGNHGAAVAYAGQNLGIKPIVFVPTNASKAKVSAMQALNADLRFHGDDGVLSERFARQYAADNKMTYVSPYNDLDVIAGQGSIGIELLKQNPDLDAVFIALGGGGLLSGTAAALKTQNPNLKVIACSPKNSAVMMHSLNAGKVLDIPSEPTLSDGTAGGVEENAITFDLCKNLIDDMIMVSEEAISTNLQNFLAEHHMLIEGAAATALAAYEQHKENLDAKNVAIVICGANISLDTLKGILN